MDPRLDTPPIYNSQLQVITHSGFEGGNPRVDGRISDRTRTEARKVQSGQNKDGVPGQLIALAEDANQSFLNGFIDELLRNV